MAVGVMCAVLCMILSVVAFIVIVAGTVPGDFTGRDYAIMIIVVEVLAGIAVIQGFAAHYLGAW